MLVSVQMGVWGGHTCLVLFRTRKVLSRFSLVVVWFGVRIGRVGDAAGGKSRVTPRRPVFGWKTSVPNGGAG